MWFIFTFVCLMSCGRCVDLHETRKGDDFLDFYTDIINDDNIKDNIKVFQGKLSGNSKDTMYRNIFMIATMACGRDQKACKDGFIGEVFSSIEDIFGVNKLDLALERDKQGNNLGSYLITGGFTNEFFAILRRMIEEKKDFTKFLENKSVSMPVLVRYECNNEVQIQKGEWGVLEIAVRRNSEFMDKWLDFVKESIIAGSLWNIILGDSKKDTSRTNFLHVMFTGDMEERGVESFMRFTKAVQEIDNGQTIRELLAQKDIKTGKRPLMFLLENASTYLAKDFLEIVFGQVIGQYLMVDQGERLLLIDSSIRHGHQNYFEAVLTYLYSHEMTSAKEIDKRMGQSNFLHKICGKRIGDDLDASMLNMPSLKKIKFYDIGEEASSEFIARKNSLEEGGQTPLHMLSQVGPELVKEGTDLMCFENVCFEEDADGLNSLHRAIVSNNLELVRALIDKLKKFKCLKYALSKSAGRPVKLGELPTMYRPTPLKLCALYGRTEIAKLLIKEGVDIDEKSGCTNALLWAAKMAGDPGDGPKASQDKIVDLLLAYNAKYRKPWKIKGRSLINLFSKLTLSVAAGIGGTFPGANETRISAASNDFVKEIDRIFIHSEENKTDREFLREEKEELYIRIHKYAKKSGWRDCKVLDEKDLNEINDELKETTV